jgi:two-component system, chemotaxis family, chemotaxis protein CheY
VEKKVIIIEDCNAISYLISTVLKKDYTITSVSDCRAAMKHLHSDADNEVMILDIADTNSENFELLQHMSTSCVLNGIRCVVISNSDDQQLKNKTEALGASLFLTKPFDPVFLSEHVRNLINVEKEPNISKKRKFSFNMNIF